MRYCHLRRLTRLLLGWACRAGMAGALVLAGLTAEASAQGLDAGRAPAQLVDDALLPADTAGCWLRIRGVPDPARVDAEEVGRQRGALSELRARGFRTCVMLRPARTSWATGVRGHPYAQLPLDLREAFAWMQRLQAAYGDLVDRWEIDNEPDVGFVPENPETYAAYLKACALGAAAVPSMGREARGMGRGAGGSDQNTGLFSQEANRGQTEKMASANSVGSVLKGPGSAPGSRLPAQNAPPAAVLMAPLALPPGPWLEAFFANDGLSYTSGFNYHFYGYAEDFTDHYRLMESAVGDLTESQLNFSTENTEGTKERSKEIEPTSARGASSLRSVEGRNHPSVGQQAAEAEGRGTEDGAGGGQSTVDRGRGTGDRRQSAEDGRRGREEDVGESAGSEDSGFSALKRWFRSKLSALRSWLVAPRSEHPSVPVGYERRTLPVFLTEYGYPMLDQDTRGSVEGRVRQWAWFRDVGAQIRELRPEGPMAFYLPPYLEYKAKEYGLAMERVVEPRMDANEREAGTTDAGARLGAEGTNSTESTEGEPPEARARSQKTEDGVSGGLVTVDREPSTVYRETRIIKGWTWQREVDADGRWTVGGGRGKRDFNTEGTEIAERTENTEIIEPNSAHGAWSLRSVGEEKTEGARASSRPTAPSSSLRSGGVVFTPGDFGAERAEPWMAGIGAQIGPWEASPALAWLLAEGAKPRRPARDWSVIVPQRSPVVIDFVAGRGLRATKSNQGYFLDSPQLAEGELRIYNFSDTAVTGILDLGELAEAEAGPARRELTLAPGELRSLPVRLRTTVGDAQPNPWRVTFEGGAVPRSVFQTKLFALPGAGTRQVAKTLSPDEAGPGHVELLRQRSLGTGEPPETVMAGWSVTRGVRVTGENGEWTFTITQLPAEPTRPAIIELILPDDFRLPSNGYLDIDYRLQPADPASDPATTPTFVAESKQLKNQVVVAWRTATGNLYGVWQPPVATTEWQRWAQRLESFTPLFYSRVKAPWRFFDQRPVALVFTLLPGELPVKLQVRRLEIVRYGDGAR